MVRVHGCTGEGVGTGNRPHSRSEPALIKNKHSSTQDSVMAATTAEVCSTKTSQTDKFNVDTAPTDVSGLVRAAKTQKRTRICLITFVAFLGVVIFAVVLTGGLLFVKDNFDQIGHLKFDPSAGLLIMKNFRGLEALRGSLGGSFGHSLFKKKIGGDSLFYEWENTVTLRVLQDSNRCFMLRWEAGNSDLSTFSDCYQLAGSHWYGGAEVLKQVWPLEKADLKMRPFLPMDYLQVKNDTAYGSVLERCWFNSKGIAILVNESVPLHVSWNKGGDGRFCLKADKQGYPTSTVPHHITYRICSGEHARDIHAHVMKHFFQLPIDIPDVRMIKEPIWSTWARYKKAVNQSVVLEFAKQIQQYGFPRGQIEIDDSYSTKYGDFDFDPVKFSNPQWLIDQLHKEGFRVTLWVHPFANTDSEAFQSGMKYWVKQRDVIGIVKWWNGAAAALDTTNSAARNWFVGRLKTFKAKYGFDSFKFDAGELTYLPRDYDLASIQNFNPACYSTKYAEMAASFGPMVEVRVGYQTQQLGQIVRMLDKDSRWDENNGLRSLIPTALTFGILGYPFILPDMIGGNGYCDVIDIAQCTAKPEKELYIRWLQANIFLPSLQFSITPWDYDNETVNIAMKMVTLRAGISDVLIKFAKEVNETGIGIIRPLWWIAPEDQTAQVIDSEFLVGSKYLVAPVLISVKQNKGKHRIYLPRGKWREEFRSKQALVVKEGKWFEYSVTLEDLPYFAYISDVTLANDDLK